MLVSFFAWERHLGRRPGGQPLVDLSLFSSPSYTWGVVLAAVAVLALMGVLFTLPSTSRAFSAPTRWGPACGCCR